MFSYVLGHNTGKCQLSKELSIGLSIDYLYYTCSRELISEYTEKPWKTKHEIGFKNKR